MNLGSKFLFHRFLIFCCPNSTHVHYHACCVLLLVQTSEGHTFFTFLSFLFSLLGKFIPDYMTSLLGRLIFIVVTL